jgi:UDPglucose--hexose-1-phosphate uridylyltransferase
VPFAPNWPYEVHVRARRHGARRLTDLTADERRDLAVALKDVVHRFDRLHEHGHRWRT